MTKKAQNKSKKKPGLTISSVKKIKLKKSITQIQKIEFWPTLKGKKNNYERKKNR